MDEHGGIEGGLCYEGLEPAKVLEVWILRDLLYACPVTGTQFFLDDEGGKSHSDRERRVADASVGEVLFVAFFELFPRYERCHFHPFVVAGEFSLKGQSEIRELKLFQIVFIHFLLSEGARFLRECMSFSVHFRR